MKKDIQNFAAVLTLANFILLVIGFFSPHTSMFWYGEPTRMASSMLYGMGFASSFFLFGIVSDKDKLSEP